MKTKNKEVAEIVKTKVTTKKELKADNATTKALTERVLTVKEKNYLYRFQVENATKNIKLDAKQEKKNRNKIRRDLKLLVNNILVDNLKKKDLSKCTTFIKFYKDNYILNDFTLKSLTNVSDETKIEDYTKVLNLCKESLTK